MITAEETRQAGTTESSGVAHRDAEVAELELSAARTRRRVLRMLQANPAGHVGGALSVIEILVALYRRAMRFGPDRVTDPQRDRFLLSAGHKALAQYAVLAEVGVVDDPVLDTYGRTGSALPGHPDLHKLPGIEANTGALGHGLPIGCGMALGARLRGYRSRVYVVLGDGELPEGSNWEAAAIAAHHRLDTLTAFVDVNGLQISGPTAQVLGMESIAAKFAAFGWAVVEIDGNDVAAVCDVLDRLPLSAGRPTAVIARTVKGKGLPGLEGTVASHYWKPTPEQLHAAIAAADAAVARAAARVQEVAR
ncbi:transketolase [Micropruina sonneratiae]|uniref:transketolase n=1 Tax=Micropruina sonneratiae TaxID=2986940 RepID=UPI0022263523|nr:transketolase [Micropruina sp. KQZ13P-5]